MFTEPSSPKIRDLRRDGRYALHCSVDREEGEPLIEFLVSGTAQVISDADVRRQAAEEITASPVVTNDYMLFEFRINNALLVEYDNDGKRKVDHLHAPKQDDQIATVDGSVGTVELN